jgi:spartin
MGGTAKNLALVYIDMRGIGRKALIKRVGKQYIKKVVAQEK